MKAFYILVMVIFLAVLTANPTAAQTPCAKIKDGTITDSAGNLITLGFDQFGYNYQAHMFNGTYDTSDRVADGLYAGSTDYASDSLIMKWSNDWLSNQDCFAPFGKLDRGGDSTNLSKGWLTNQVEGDYIGSDGDSHHYTYFVKIVYDAGAACNATPVSPTCIWGTFTIIEEVYNDPFSGFHGVDHSRLARPGLGFYTN